MVLSGGQRGPDSEHTFAASLFSPEVFVPTRNHTVLSPTEKEAGDVAQGAPILELSLTLVPCEGPTLDTMPPHALEGKAGAGQQAVHTGSETGQSCC